jgi:hypothetical protein
MWSRTAVVCIGVEVLLDCIPGQTGEACTPWQTMAKMEETRVGFSVQNLGVAKTDVMN